MKERVSEIPLLPATESVTGAFKFIPDMTNDELRKLAREKLSNALQAIDPISQPGMTQKLCAELMDRIDGKPAQIVDQRNLNVNVSVPLSEADQATLDHYYRTKYLSNGKDGDIV